MKRQIPWPQLPRTIQDAIELTRHLGVKYLWVDALCILQSEGLDDQKHREDWSCEVVRFGKYYENALLTIAATGGSSSEQGLFFSRPLSQFGPTSITFQTADHSIYTVRSRVLDWRTETITAPLFKRGWAIQERLLSRRVLHFARNMILWECQECRATELDPKGLNPRGLDDDGGVEDECITKYRDLHVMDLTPEDAIEEWYRFLHIYSKSNFTFVSDRLPALSGIATIIQKHIKQIYIAGLWELDIARGLAWYSWGPFSFDTAHLSGPRITSSPKKADSQLKLPSWSWAVSKSCILYFSNHDWTPLVELESYEVDSQGTSTSGQLRGAKLTLRGVLAMVNLSDLGFVPHADKVNVLRRGLEDYVSRFEAVCMDTILDSQTGYGFYPCLLLGSASPGSGDDTAGGALILKMTGQCLDNVKVYQRVGFMSLPIDECLSIFTGKKTTINLV
ncbi:hypothetical protein FPOAC1_004152 [Fusarium poae]|uniref:hypothetical protein n=1 Tax=Fusarium poae TaxID=36050 RepID=UPI001CE7AA61|nr:hypothetical protein FPOAC1_004152 [Fusarium poae]KAG8670917.1 hypothetical protein FPOAC1_004152 [Fusarium poae]